MLLAVLMVLTTGIAAVLPAVAEDGGNEAKIGETEYATLGEAIDASKDGDTITILRDLTLTAINKEIYKNITIDGGESKYKITASGGYTFQFCDSFTLKNLKMDTQAGFRFWNTSRNGRGAVVGTLENVEWTVGTGLFVNLQGEKKGIPQTLNIVNSTIIKPSGKGDSLIATYNKGLSDITITVENSTLTQAGGTTTSGSIGNRAVFYFQYNSNVVLNLKGNSTLNYNPQGCANAVHAFFCTKEAKVTVNADSSVRLNLLDSGAETAGNYFTYITGTGEKKGTVTVNDAGAAWNISAAIARRGFYLPAPGSYDVNETGKAVVKAGVCCHGDTALTYRKAAADYAETELSETERLYSGYSFKVGTDSYQTWADALKAEGDIKLIANAPHIDTKITLAKDAVIDGQGEYALSACTYFFNLAGHNATFRNLAINTTHGVRTDGTAGPEVLFEDCTVNVTGGLLVNFDKNANVTFRNTKVISTATDPVILIKNKADSEIQLVNSTIDYRKGSTNNANNTAIFNISGEANGTVIVDGTSKLIYNPDNTMTYNQIFAINQANTVANITLKPGATLEYNTVPASDTKLAFLRTTDGNTTLNLVDEGAIWTVSEAVAKKGYRFVNHAGTFNCRTVAMKAADGKLYSPTADIKQLTAKTSFAPVCMGVTNEAGASIRLNLPTGIRFGTQIDKTFYETLGASAVYGVRVARKDVLQNGNFAALTDENSISYDSANANFRWVTEGAFFRTVLMNINEANYQTALCWNAYVTVTYADGTTATFWADWTERDNCRSLAQVAQSALADTTVTWTEAEKALLNTIAGN